MTKLLTLLLVIGIAYATYYLSSWRLMGELKRRSARLRDPDLAPVLDRLAQGLGKPRIEVYLYDESSINGLTAPNGRVYITKGLYRKYREGEVSAEEIASVIAHEFGHVAMGHSQRRMMDMTGANAVRMMLVALIGRFIPFVGGWIANGVAQMLAAALSRRDEYEADKYAAALLKEVGIGTDPQVSLLEKLDLMTGSFGRPPAWLMSHPRTEDRINAILEFDEQEVFEEKED